MQNIYGVPPPPIEEHQKAIDHINTIAQGMQIQIHNLGVLAQDNAILKISNKSVMDQLEHMNVDMESM